MDGLSDLCFLLWLALNANLTLKRYQLKWHSPFPISDLRLNLGLCFSFVHLKFRLAVLELVPPLLLDLGLGKEQHGTDQRRHCSHNRQSE